MALLPAAFTIAILGCVGCSTGQSEPEPAQPDPSSSAQPSLSLEASCLKIKEALKPLQGAKSDKVAMGEELASLESEVEPQLQPHLMELSEALEGSKGNAEVLEEGSAARTALRDLDEQCSDAGVTLEG